MYRMDQNAHVRQRNVQRYNVKVHADNDAEQIVTDCQIVIKLKGDDT